MSSLVSSTTSSQNSWRRHVVAVGVPLALTGLAYALWWISDRLVSVGPFDRATFGWIVVIPLWIAAPVAAGFTWRPLDRRTTRIAAGLVGTLIAAVTALLLWQAVAYPNCEAGAIHTPPEMVLPSLVVGTVVGGALASSGLVTTWFARQGRLVAALVLGAAASAVTFGAVILVAAAVLLGPACQRPSI